MATAYNVVRFRAKPGREQDFIEAQRKSMSTPLPGFLGGGLVKTGDRAYCFVGHWESFDRIVAARTQMISFLDDVRDMLEDLGNGLGVTDPVSGETVLEIAP